jgi:hypothetical protein
MRSSKALVHSCGVALLAFSAAGTAFAQKPPQVGYVFPPAVEAGAETDVHLGGFDFTPDLQWFVHDSHVRLTTSGIPGDYQLTPPPYWVGPRAGVASLPLAREVSGRLNVDAEAPAGLVRWQVANANGASQTAVFYVSRGHEMVEARSRDLPQRLPALPVAVSGRLSRLTEVDRYEVLAERDGLISVDLMSRRLGANFYGILRVRDSSDQLVADLADMQGVDGAVTFAARAGEVYTIELHDAEFRGDCSFIYRLAVSADPRVQCTLPASVRRGTTDEVEFVGVGVATGAPVLESVRQEVSFPASPELDAYTHSLMTPYGAVDVTIPLSDLEERAGISGAVLAAPLAATNAFSPDADEQRFTWQVTQDEHWSLALQSRAIGGRLDVALKVLDPAGNMIAENDDLPGTIDAGLAFKAAATGDYTCVVRSMASRGGTADEVYRLEIVRSTPDFTLTAPQQVTIPLGGKVEVPVQVVRQAGWDGEVVLSAHGLPAGVTTAGECKIPAGAGEGKLVLESAADVAVVAALIRIDGAATIGEAQVTRTAMAVAAGNLAPRSPDQQRTSRLLLAMTMPPPFEVKLIDRTRQRDVHRGSTCLAEMEIVRQPGFAGEIRLEMAATQARYLCGSHGSPVVVPPDVTHVIYPVWMSEHLATDFTIRMATQGVAAVPDPQGNLRYLTQPADAQITMIMEGALLKLSTSGPDAVVPIGESFSVPVRVSRSPRLPNAAMVELQVPDEIAGFLHAESLTLPPGQDQGELRITLANDARLAGDWLLTLRATALQEDQWPVISDAELPLRLEAR